MKTIYKEFFCPQCEGLRYINVNGICYECKNENNLESLVKKRKIKHKLNNYTKSLAIEV